MTYLLFYATSKFKNNSYSNIVDYLKSIGKCSVSRMDNNYSVLIEECDKTFIELKFNISTILIKQNNENFILYEIDIINQYDSFNQDKFIDEMF